MIKTIIIILLLHISNKCITGIKQPNIVFILTDDQDRELDSLSAMPKLQSLIQEKGATFTNSYVATPLCCPSRSSILSGQYVHNHGTVNNSISGGCSSTSWQEGPEKSAFPVLLQNAGYKTFFAGKYLNQYGMDAVGGVAHVPPGWDSWIGLQGNSIYYYYTLSVNGTAENHANNPNKDYLTNVIKNNSLKYIEDLSENDTFFMMLSTPACHDPVTPEPKYQHSLNSSTIPETSNFNIENGEEKNWFVRLGEQPLRDSVITDIEEMYRNRLRTLLSVDDMVEDVIKALEYRNFLDNTYIFFSSDNGYHLGQFSMPKDKREPYEFDIKVPLMVRGPDIEEGIAIEAVTTNIDLAPTFLELAGVPIPERMDGLSLTSFMFNGSSETFERSILVEHFGEGIDALQEGCESLGLWMAYCLPEFACKCQDSSNNTYSCIRTLGNDVNEKFCKWDDTELFEEYYDIEMDPYEVSNMVKQLNETYHNNLINKLESLVSCSGENCILT